jgi:hypothetical protein
MRGRSEEEAEKGSEGNYGGNDECLALMLASLFV